MAHGPCQSPWPLQEVDDPAEPGGRAMEPSSPSYTYRTSHKAQTLLDLQQLVEVLNSRQPRDEVKEQVLVLLEANPSLVAAYRRSKIRL